MEEKNYSFLYSTMRCMTLNTIMHDIVGYKHGCLEKIIQGFMGEGEYWGQLPERAYFLNIYFDSFYDLCSS